MLVTLCAGALILWVVISPVTSTAQVLTVPTTWKSPSFKSSRDDRMTRADQDLAYLLIYTDPNNPFHLNTDGPISNDPWMSSNYMAAYAMNDYVTGSEKWRSNITEILFLGKDRGYEDITYVNIAAGWGLACVYAYLAYKDPELLQGAQDAWTIVSAYQIDQEQANTGVHRNRNITFSTQCNHQPVVGGVFKIESENDQGDLTISGLATSYFFSLSAHLADLVNSNSDYLNAARLAAQFIQLQLSDSSSLVYDSIKLDGTCRVTDTPEPESTGAVIEGMAVLANVTGNSTWLDRATDMFLSASQYSGFSGTDSNDGIITWGDDSALTQDPRQASAKGYFLRSVYHLWLRNGFNITLAAYIESYLAVQYNAMLDTYNSTLGAYGPIWDGARATNCTPAGAIASVDLLAIGMGPSPSSLAQYGPEPLAVSTSSSSSTASPTANPTSNSPADDTPVIVGVVCGVLLIVALVAGLLWLRRRRRRRAPSTDILDTSELPAQVTALERSESVVILPTYRQATSPGCPRTVNSAVSMGVVAPVSPSGRALPEVPGRMPAAERHPEIALTWKNQTPLPPTSKKHSM